LAHFGHAAIAELSPVSGIKRKLDVEPAKGSFWRKADVQIRATRTREVLFNEPESGYRPSAAAETRMTRFLALAEFHLKCLLNRRSLFRHWPDETYPQQAPENPANRQFRGAEQNSACIAN
jgi:hypothetical protein